MSLTIPNLYEAGVHALTICGDIETDDKNLHQWAVSHEANYYDYLFRLNDNELFCRVSIDDHEDSIHFHTEWFTDEWSPKGFPKPSENAPSLDDLVQPARGLTWDVDVFIYFPALSETWPSIMAATTRLAIKRDNLVVTMTGGTLSVDGAPLTKINWQIDPDDGDRALVSMKGVAAIKLADSYFQECLEFITSYAHTFFEKGRADG
jgi:hypothetical protein